MLVPGHALPILTAADMRVAEAAAMAAGVSDLVLMERAVAAALAAIQSFEPGHAVLVLCGPGNNGGDGYGIAAELRARGRDVTVAALGVPTAGAAAVMAARWGDVVLPLAAAPSRPVVVDALFGTGLTRALPDDVQAVLDRLRGAARAVIAVDIASGLHADTGAAMGRPLAADLTVTFGAAKRGHLLGEGAALTGRLVVADIGVACVSGTSLVTPPRRLPLPADTHKYRRGSVAVIAGALSGAARLTALAALRTGAGLVTLICPNAAVPADAIMQRDDAAGLALLADPRTRAIAIGPGLAADQRGRDWLARVLAGTIPAVIDAGALALLGEGPQDAFATATAPLVLTPHDGEFARLFGAIGADRIGAAQAAAVASGAVVLLKGSQTIIAAPDGRTAVNGHAAPWLATAGAGDALTGIIAALLAQGLAPFDAASVGAWLHGDCGRRGGPGLIADDIPALLPAVLAAP
ncbi:MAG: bifunctional ADP-dependent NAD(P)H-hydrate dehydratase/NAD(P)H-hydrate epimerase [Alphaproteobacteria bacterium PA4]|nr:MAG: bifunctional ADP-dependent NAD(P)H-hydrate dehydratase/NAD(P)H-hydrate epimerase [Alphaproteobacteria bacterium PA4]